MQSIVPSTSLADGKLRAGLLHMPRIGLISDTHGLLRPQALAALSGCARIVHAGDVGDAALLDALAAIAPVTAVRGNNDAGGRAGGLPMTADFVAGAVRLHVLHDIADLDFDPVAAGVRVVISGHSHKPSIEERNGVLFVNPGSAGPRRFRLPLTVALLEIDGSAVFARIIDLAVPTGAAPGQPARRATN